jgi:hypothetical protein
MRKRAALRTARRRVAIRCSALTAFARIWHAPSRAGSETDACSGTTWRPRWFPSWLTGRRWLEFSFAFALAFRVIGFTLAEHACSLRPRDV